MSFIIDAGNIALLVVGILYSIILHEIGHGYVAFRHGDDTAYRAGRLSLNPIVHIDPLGTIIIPLILFFTTGSAFGWAKPVPVNPMNYNHPRADLRVSLAGVTVNFILAFLFFGIFAWSLRVPGWGASLLSSAHSGRVFGFSLLHTGVFPTPLIFLQLAALNILLMIFNLLPFPPLDGYHVLLNFLPRSAARWYAKNQTIFSIIFLVLLFSGLLSYVYNPIFILILSGFMRLFGV